MPITAIRCPACEVQPTDHFVGTCPLSPSERNWYHHIVEHELGDKLHCDGTLTPTRLLTCPRKTLLQDFTPYTLDVASHNSPAVGTKIHEVTSRSALRLKGTLFGLPIEGECDNHVETPTGWWIDDTKSHSDYRMSRVTKEEAGDELTAQLGLYGLMFEQEYPDRKVGRLTGSHFSPYFGFRVVEVPIMDAEWIGNVRPLGNPFTVKQLAGFYQNALGSLRSPQYVTQSYEVHAWKIAEAVPKVGAEMLKQKKGSWMCDHCEVRGLCDSLG
jgi:hypothetical protein